MKYSYFLKCLVEFIKEDSRWNSIKYLEFGIRTAETFNSISPLCELAVGVDVQDCSMGMNLSSNVLFYNMTTDEYIERFLSNGDVMFNVVFIDAFHSEVQVSKDFWGVFPYVVDNGIIIMHDTFPKSREHIDINWCGDCYKFAWDLRRNHNDVCEICTIPANFGLSIVRKSNKQLCFLLE